MKSISMMKQCVTTRERLAAKGIELPELKASDEPFTPCGSPERKALKRRWEKDPHCFWCGEPTIWEDRDGGGFVSEDAATIDHLRSRFCKARTTKKDRGVWVLSCQKCNHERARMEEHWIRVNGSNYLRADGHRTKAPATVRRAQSKVCDAIKAFLKSGGQLNGEQGYIDSLLCWVSRLNEEYLALTNQAEQFEGGSGI